MLAIGSKVLQVRLEEKYMQTEYLPPGVRVPNYKGSK